MRAKLNIVFICLLLMSLFSSCLTCSKPVLGNENRYNQNESRFGDEVELSQRLINGGITSNRPAASRPSDISVKESIENVNSELVNNEVFFPKSDLEEVEIESDFSRKEKIDEQRSKRRSKFKQIKNVLKEKKRGGGDIELILLVILAIILPPLAVFLVEDTSKRFWIDLILWIIGWVLFGWLIGSIGGLIGLCALAAIVLALLIVLDVI